MSQFILRVVMLIISCVLSISHGKPIDQQMDPTNRLVKPYTLFFCDHNKSKVGRFLAIFKGLNSRFRQKKQICLYRFLGGKKN